MPEVMSDNPLNSVKFGNPHFERVYEGERRFSVVDKQRQLVDQKLRGVGAIGMFLHIGGIVLAFFGPNFGFLFDPVEQGAKIIPLGFRQDHGDVGRLRSYLCLRHIRVP